MVLPAGRGIDARQLGQGQPRAGHGSGDGDDAVEQRDGAAGLDGNGEAGGDGDPAVGDVVADGDDVEMLNLRFMGVEGGRPVTTWPAVSSISGMSLFFFSASMVNMEYRCVCTAETDNGI